MPMLAPSLNTKKFGIEGVQGSSWGRSDPGGVGFLKKNSHIRNIKYYLSSFRLHYPWIAKLVQALTIASDVSCSFGRRLASKHSPYFFLRLKIVFHKVLDIFKTTLVYLKLLSGATTQPSGSKGWVTPHWTNAVTKP